MENRVLVDAGNRVSDLVETGKRVRGTEPLPAWKIIRKTDDDQREITGIRPACG